MYTSGIGNEQMFVNELYWMNILTFPPHSFAYALPQNVRKYFAYILIPPIRMAYVIGLPHQKLIGWVNWEKTPQDKYLSIAWKANLWRLTCECYPKHGIFYSRDVCTFWIDIIPHWLPTPSSLGTSLFYTHRCMNCWRFRNLVLVGRYRR